MKKTLVALAVLAASGASFAQATITGNYTFGYVTESTPAANSTVSGLKTDTAAITVAASEDLGGGLKASAKVSLGGMMRDGAGTGEDASVTLAGGFGSVTFGTVESGNGLLAIGSSGASGFGLDGKVISGPSNIDIISLSMPLSAALKVGASYVDRGTSAAASSGTGGSGGPTGAQPSMGLSLTYAAGPLTAKGDFTGWTRQNELTPAAVAMTNRSRVRLSGAYDMGVARLSAGYSNLERTTNQTTTETLVGVAVPFGAVTAGLDYAVSSTTNNPQDRSGYSLGVAYSLSKMTNVSASYYSWKTNTIGGENTGFRTFLSKSF